MTGHAEKAEALFRSGYNCAQAVFGAYADDIGMDQEAAARLSSSFGGGMGRMREVCGAVSGALMALGSLKGYSDPSDADAKAAHYLQIQDFAREFRALHGSIICRELLEGVETVPGNLPEARTEKYYGERPCPYLVRDAAMLLERMLQEKTSQ